MNDLFTIMNNYPTLFFYDKLAFFIRKYLPSKNKQIQTPVLWEMFTRLYPDNELPLSYEDFLDILRRAIGVYDEYLSMYIYGGGVDTMDNIEYILGEKLYDSPYSGIYNLFYNTILLTYEEERSKTLEIKLNNEKNMPNIMIYWAVNLVKFNEFEFC